jgi:hypothetical protein
MSHSRRAVELLNSNDKVVDAWSVGTVLPFAVVSDAVDFVVESKRTALGNVGLGVVSQLPLAPTYRFMVCSL